ncbi:hypothetical protein ACODYM_28945 [Burkholderia gladioli]|uniref:hypothetical protein n=1 Tax=Burkholderia gladioli TaxID=28095 RepID=UPI003B5103BC
MNQTWEELIRNGSGLRNGQHCVTLRRNRVDRVGVVLIKARATYILYKPETDDMYTGWGCLLGDRVDWTKSPDQARRKACGLIVWPTKNADFMRQFENPSIVIEKS